MKPLLPWSDPPPMPPKNKLTEEQEYAKDELFWLLEDIFKIYGRGDDASRVMFFINRFILRLDELPNMLKLNYFSQYTLLLEERDELKDEVAELKYRITDFEKKIK